MSLETDYENLGERKIAINKFISRINKKARANAKTTSCYLCGESCSSFCNSHSVPQFTLENISANGYVSETLQGELPTTEKPTGINKAGTFRIICHNCDNTVFKDYEKADVYAEYPDNIVLAEIALKNYLQMISKRRIETELYDLLEQRFDNYANQPGQSATIEEIDLAEFQNGLQYALQSIAGKDTKRYYLCYYQKLDYVVPYATQSPLSLLVDFEGNVINNIYNFSEEYSLKHMHVVVFPLKATSIVMLFVENGTKRYRRFIRQLKKLDKEDQLASINYMIFSYTENVFINPDTYKILKKNKAFMEVCHKTAIVKSLTTLSNPLEIAIKDYDFSQRHNIPNLLNNEYAIKTNKEFCT